MGPRILDIRSVDSQVVSVLLAGSFSSPIKVNAKSQHTLVEARSDSRLLQ